MRGLWTVPTPFSRVYSSRMMKKIPLPFRVQSLRYTAPDVIVLDLAPESGEVFGYKPGQFVMLRLLNSDGTLWRANAYSLCSIPSNKKTIQLGIKVAGEFSQRVAVLKVGDRVEVRGPHGIFTLVPSAPAQVMFAAGIGIAPFMSMIRAAAYEKLSAPVTLFYSSKQDIAFLPELTELVPACPALSIVFVGSCAARSNLPGSCEPGRITDAIIRKYVKDFSLPLFSLCGPEGFMDAVKAILVTYGVDTKRIRSEKF